MRASRLKSIAGHAAALMLFASLAACGGGGGGDSAPAAGTGAPVNVPSGSVQALQPACTGCSAVDASTYSGSGTGVWQADNIGTSPTNVPLSINGLRGQKVTLVFTNESSANQTMPGIALTQSMTVAHSLLQSESAASAQGEDPTLAAIRQFNYKGWADLASAAKSQAVMRSQVAVPSSPSASYSVNAQRDFYYSDLSLRHTTLEEQATTQDGTTINLWVENTELGTTQMTPALIHTLLMSYAQPGGIYDMVTGVGGKLYGPNSQTVLIDGTNQPIDLVVLNFNHDGKAFGTIGYFWGLNDFKKGTGQSAYSNESISLYLDSETLYLGGASGFQQMLTTMAHESTHMQNFYRRAVLMGSQYAFEPWLEEMSAMMMEDWTSFNIDPTHAFNAIRDVRFYDFMTYNNHGSYNCGLTNWTPFATDCESYSVSGSFGGFLNRQLGLAFYKALLTNKGQTDSLAILNDVINQIRPGSSVQQELRHFSAAAEGLIPATTNVAQYAFPARSEGGFTLPAIDPTSSEYPRALPAAVPAVLMSLGSFPVVRPAVTGTYTETVRVPPGTTLSVIID
ncbi:M30 family zinc metallopeptidase [Paraburkholderia sp. GAS334]|uniref:M30 family zinc metallopeptidase n=1 Tax=Paraburkholderia sp. GAS334 TaxID=3035131 RepID=UPI003D1EC5C2